MTIEERARAWARDNYGEIDEDDEADGFTIYDMGAFGRSCFLAGAKAAKGEALDKLNHNKEWADRRYDRAKTSHEFPQDLTLGASAEAMSAIRAVSALSPASLLSALEGEKEQK